ncbi:hypothetical protein DFR70_107282 [Nocardia tenerifensis]|uniref:Uncharacterized protein n=1 Tax=Nocardia tenerifensis TaxID=228006 RepID=A0A318K1E0_9NOCA|nr:hypothetical protein [Nocardia tenerifensis]PXX62414.1 hypothetical protein DFR70_107282 [Nocardia tenerifensis]
MNGNKTAADRPAEQAPERADLVAWRRRDALRRSSAAQPVANKRKYRRGSKHRKATVE